MLADGDLPVTPACILGGAARAGAPGSRCCGDCASRLSGEDAGSATGLKRPVHGPCCPRAREGANSSSVGPSFTLCDYKSST